MAFIFFFYKFAVRTAEVQTSFLGQQSITRPWRYVHMYNDDHELIVVHVVIGLSQ